MHPRQSLPKSVSIYLNQFMLLPIIFKVDNLTYRMAEAGDDIKIDKEQSKNLRVVSLIESGMGGRKFGHKCSKN